MMKGRTKYILFVALVHGVALGLAFFIFQESRMLFLAAEVVILISIAISWRLYSQLIRPLNRLARGADAIRERDFGMKFVPTGEYEMDRLIEVYNEMADMLRVERTRHEQQQLFLSKLIETSPMGIVIFGYDDEIAEMNPRAKALPEIDAVMQQAKLLKSGESKVVNGEGIALYKLHKAHFIDKGFPRHFILIEDLTAEVLAAEKKAYGKVIRMMAHEVNNTVGPVNSILQSALRVTEEARLQDALQVAMDRNHNLNQFMRNFAEVVRLPEPVRKSFDLHELVAHIGALMELKAGEKEIDLEIGRAGGEFYIVADWLQMEQALINVVKNAIEAIGTRGRVVLATDAVHRRLVIADTGAGIPASVAVELFSPFFSTKRDGQGIGLTLVKEVLLNHGYSFSLKTAEAGRTEFVIWFGEN